MTALLEKIFSLSITASFLMVAVIVLRLLLKKSPKGMRYFLWAMVGLRLVFPFEIESPFSVLPSKTELKNVSVPTPNVSENTISTIVSDGINVLDVLTYVWITGAVLMLLYMLISFIRVHLMVRESVVYKDGIYLCDHVRSPFVLGVLNPKIYLNSSMSKRDMKLIIAHERTHIKHGDNIWKPLGFILLSIYWFNPLCWVSYFLFVKDIELFCDESVVKTLSKKGKKNYSYALLSCSTNKNMATACPLAFAENSVKLRVRNILGYKKPAVYIIAVSVALCVVTMLMFMTSPVSAKEVEKSDVVEATATAETIKETTVETTAPTVSETQAPTVASKNALTEKPAEKDTVNDNSSTNEYSQSIDNSYNNNSDDSTDTIRTEPNQVGDVGTLRAEEEEDSNYSGGYGYPYPNSSYVSPYDGHSNNGSNYHYPFEKNNTTNQVIQWDMNSSSSSGVQRADGWLTGLN